jgi:hypothetical protein
MTRIPAALFIATSIAACSGASSPSENRNFSWTVDGQTTQATDMGAMRVSNTTSLDGAHCQGGNHFQIQLRTEVVTGGVYSIPSETLFVSFTPDARTGAAASDAYRESNFFTRETGSGSVTITAVSASSISGTFNFVLVAEGPNISGTKAISGGFTLPFGEERIC